MRINFDFLDLEVFLAVKDTGSFYAASAAMNLSQSSITRRIQKLEEALGTPLFERTTREVKPTLAAKRLQSRAEAMLQDAQETTLAMRDETDVYRFQRAKLLTIATIPTVIRALLAPVISDLRDGSRQNIRVRILDLAANEVAEAVAQGEVDFGVGSIPELEQSTDFKVLINEPLGIALPRAHPWAKLDFVAWHDLTCETLILPARGTGNRLLIDEAMARSGDPLAWSYEVNRTSTALDLVSKGAGVAPVPKMATAGIDTDDVLWRPLVDPVVSRPIGLISRLGQKDTVIAKQLKDALIRKSKTNKGT